MSDGRIGVTELPRGFTPTDVPIEVVKIGLGGYGAVVMCPRVGMAEVRLMRGRCGGDWVNSPVWCGEGVVEVDVNDVPVSRLEEMWRGLLEEARKESDDGVLPNALPYLLDKLGYVWDGKLDFEGIGLRSSVK